MFDMSVNLLPQIKEAQSSDFLKSNLVPVQYRVNMCLIVLVVLDSESVSVSGHQSLSVSMQLTLTVILWDGSPLKSCLCSDERQ